MGYCVCDKDLFEDVLFGFKLPCLSNSCEDGAPLLNTFHLLSPWVLTRARRSPYSPVLAHRGTKAIQKLGLLRFSMQWPRESTLHVGPLKSGVHWDNDVFCMIFLNLGGGERILP